jgi:hypothetical protein
MTEWWMYELEAFQGEGDEYWGKKKKKKKKKK